jgi:hypothetical protein
MWASKFQARISKTLLNWGQAFVRAGGYRRFETWNEIGLEQVETPARQVYVNRIIFACLI